MTGSVMSIAPGQVSQLYRLRLSSSVLQHFRYSSSSSKTEEKENSQSEENGGNSTEVKGGATETGEDAEVAEQKMGSSYDSLKDADRVYLFDSYSNLDSFKKRMKRWIYGTNTALSGTDTEEELTMEDLIKLLTEKEELLKVKQKEIDNVKVKVMRSYAEMENVMDRTKREAENSKKFAIQSFAKGLLDVSDNLGRASSVVKKSFSKIDTLEDNSGAVPLLKTLLEGVNMTEKQLTEVFKKFGVEKYDPTDEQFDPNKHEAVFHVPDASKPPGTVAIVLKSGYVLLDQVIQPAEVGVTEAVANTEAVQGTKEW